MTATSPLIFSRALGILDFQNELLEVSEVDLIPEVGRLHPSKEKRPQKSSAAAFYSSIKCYCRN